MARAGSTGVPHQLSGKIGIMGEIVNLNRARKERARRRKAEDAAANRRKFGRTKGEEQAESQERDRSVDRLDAHRLPPQPPDGPDGPDEPA